MNFHVAMARTCDAAWRPWAIGAAVAAGCLAPVVYLAIGLGLTGKMLLTVALFGSMCYAGHRNQSLALHGGTSAVCWGCAHVLSAIALAAGGWWVNAHVHAVSGIPEVLDQLSRVIPWNDPTWTPLLPGASRDLLWVYDWSLPTVIIVGACILAVAPCYHPRGFVPMAHLWKGLLIATACSAIVGLILPIPDPWVLTTYWLGDSTAPNNVFGSMKRDGMPFMTGAFPSMHVGWPATITCVLWIHGYRKSAAATGAITCAIGAIVILLRLHWVMDVPAGLLLGFASARLACNHAVSIGSPTGAVSQGPRGIP